MPKEIIRLVLFDIDGTLLTTNGYAVKVMMAAMEAVWGDRPANDGFLMDGKTELRIVHELLIQSGLTRPEIDRGLEKFWPLYESELEKWIAPGRTTVYKGVDALLGRLAGRDDVLMGLLTGNCEAAARIKLAAAGLGGMFALGAFGERNEERNELPAIAVVEAERHHGVSLGGKSVVVLGDTPNDILCTRPMGLRAIAVATGNFDVAELERYSPDSCFVDLSNTGQVLEAIMDDPGN